MELFPLKSSPPPPSYVTLHYFFAFCICLCTTVLLYFHKHKQYIQFISFSRAIFLCYSFPRFLCVYCAIPTFLLTLPFYRTDSFTTFRHPLRFCMLSPFHFEHTQTQTKEKPRDRDSPLTKLTYGLSNSFNSLLLLQRIFSKYEHIGGIFLYYQDDYIVLDIIIYRVVSRAANTTTTFSYSNVLVYLYILYIVYIHEYYMIEV